MGKNILDFFRFRLVIRTFRNLPGVCYPLGLRSRIIILFSGEKNPTSDYLNEKEFFSLKFLRILIKDVTLIQVRIKDVPLIQIRITDVSLIQICPNAGRVLYINMYVLYISLCL